MDAYYVQTRNQVHLLLRGLPPRPDAAATALAHELNAVQVLHQWGGVVQPRRKSRGGRGTPCVLLDDQHGAVQPGLELAEPVPQHVPRRTAHHTLK